VYAPDGTRTEVSPEEIRPAQHIGVASGQTIPVDGVLASLDASLGLAWINGESAPRLFRASQRVLAGAQNLSREEIRIIATQAWEGSLFAELLKPAQPSATAPSSASSRAISSRSSVRRLPPVCTGGG
jgi:cation transport ATPase